jgi:hypothetical protein
MNSLHRLVKSNLLPDEMLRLILTCVNSKSHSWRSIMQSRQNIYNYIGLVSAIAAAAALGLSAGPGFAGTASAVAQSDKTPHAWGLTAPVIAVAPAAQSDKTPHAWGRTAPVIAVAPAAQSDKTPHAWGVAPVDIAGQALSKLKP